MKNDNKGFTIAELIVSMLIFSIVVAAAFGFMLSSANTYSSVTDRLGLQVSSQLALNQISAQLMDCDTGFCFDDAADTLYMIDKDQSGNCTAHIYALRSGSLYYDKATATLEPDGAYHFSVGAGELLTNDVDTFSVVPIPNTVSAGGAVSSAAVTIEFKSKSASYDGEKTVALRNTPVLATIAINP